jgi:hypothetical protein
LQWAVEYVDKHRDLIIQELHPVRGHRDHLLMPVRR